MNIVESKVEFLPFTNKVSHVAKCARICYASEGGTPDKKLYFNLWKNRHRSMFRHAPAYYILPVRLDIKYEAFKDVDCVIVNEWLYLSTNEQAAQEYWDVKYKEYRISWTDAHTHPIFKEYKLLRYTFIVESGIDITRELNRKSPNSIAEQSTRYVDFNKRVGIRFKQCHWMYGLSLYKYCLVRLMCRVSAWFYKLSRSKYGLNLPPEDARWILPLDTMSKVAYTYSVKEWERIINLRVFDWTGKAHKDAKAVVYPIKSALEALGYKIENYKENGK